MATIEINTKNFKSIVDQGGLVLIDWWAPWCGPCRAFGPIYERASEKHPEATFGKINTEESPELARAFEINSIPTLMAIRDGVLLYNEAGMLPPPALERLITEVQNLDIESLKKQSVSQRPSAPPPME